jgi:hypothetical protein
VIHDQGKNKAKKEKRKFQAWVTGYNLSWSSRRSLTLRDLSV